MPRAFPTRPAALAVAFVLALALAPSRAPALAQSPPWGEAAYDAEIAIHVGDRLELVVRVETGAKGVRYTATGGDGTVQLEALLLWEDGAPRTFVREAGAFEPVPGLASTVLESVVDPREPRYGRCAAAGVSCADEGADTRDGRATRRLRIDQEGIGVSTVWVDQETGLTIASEADLDGTVVSSELRSFQPGPPPDARFER